MKFVQWISNVFMYIIVLVNAQYDEFDEEEKSFVTVGAIFDKYAENRTEVLRYAVNVANEKILAGQDIDLNSDIKTIPFGHVFSASQSVCELFKNGAGIIIGPQWSQSVSHVINICDAKEIPYIDTNFDEDAATKRSVINMYPSHDTLDILLVDVIKAFGWEKFTIVYQSSTWLQRIDLLLQMNNLRKQAIAVHQLVVENAYFDFRATLREIKISNQTNIVLSVSTSILQKVLNQALQVGILTDKYNFIVNNLDMDSIDVAPFKYGGANITTFRIISFENREWSDLNQHLYEKNVELNSNNAASEDIMKQFNSFAVQEAEIDLDECSFNDQMLIGRKLENALIFDGVMTFALALQQLGGHQVRSRQISCSDPSSVWDKGFTIANFMKNVKFVGLTGPVEFDTDGTRRNINVDLIELQTSGFEKVGNWKWAETHMHGDRLMITRPPVVISGRLKLRIITTLTEPYTMLKDTAIELSGNDRYEGYAIDIIQELSELIDFDYEIIIQEDKNNGEYSPVTGKWDGMIGKIISGEADLAITDLTMTSDRIRAIDFSPAIMNLGIAILYRKPSRAEPSTWSFMTPFAQEVWIYLALTYVFVSFCFFILGRISPSQWENPYPCVEEPEFLENQFTLQNSMWFAVGALLQQGSELEPKAASIRLASSVWWFFTLIMVSSYTANLAACLTVDEPQVVIKGIETLRECAKSKEGCAIKFGAKHGGSTLMYFQNHEKEMYEYMIKNQALTADNDEGLIKVLDKTQNYAFLMESSTISYHTERKCNISIVGDLIDDKNYAIGMRKNYEYRDAIARNILLLQEKGTIDKIQTRWWKQKRGGGACTKKESARPEELGLINMKGVFYVLGFGTILAMIYGCIEETMHIFKESRRKGVSFRKSFRQECRFLLIAHKRVKPVHKAKQKSKSNSTHSSNSNS